MKPLSLVALLVPALFLGSGLAQTPAPAVNCQGLPGSAQLKAFLKQAPGLSDPPIGGQVGGLFNGARMWGTVVNRNGEVCAIAASTDDVTQVWPGSRHISKSKAYTANAFSLDNLALSTARLYTFTQPGHSLWSLGQSNIFPSAGPSPLAEGGPETGLSGGLIFFGGGVPLYSSGKIIGGLGISGDTSCADHEIAKRVRHIAGLNPPGGPAVDDISYSFLDGASVFTHPQCLNTYRNGLFVGSERVSSGY